MHARNLPTPGPRYWTALSLASVFGANMGDFVSRVLHLGHANGLLPLAAILALILWLERRSRATTEAYYWLAIVTLRTAATNLGDLATHDFALGYPMVMAALAALLAGILVAENLSLAPRAGTPDQARGLPAANGFYWSAMLVAGTLGTAAGDYVAGVLGLGVGLGTIVLSVPLSLLLFARSVPGLATRPTYWLTVVAVRSAGTTAGDFCAGRHGLALGLPVSTALTGAAFVGLLLLWRPPSVPRAVEA